MPFEKVDHIGIAVANLEEAVTHYQKLLGKPADHYEEVASQQVKAAFFGVGPTNLELLAATAPESPIAKFIAKNGRGGLHHICLQVRNIEAELQRLKKAGVQLIDEEPILGAHGKKVAFIHPKATGGVLLELSEPIATKAMEV